MQYFYGSMVLFFFLILHHLKVEAELKHVILYLYKEDEQQQTQKLKTQKDNP